MHKVFLEAALNRGTAESLAKTLYAGVLYGGPRWEKPKASISWSDVRMAQVVPTPPTTPKPPSGKTDKQAFEDLKAWIEQEKPTLEEIRKRVEEIRKAQRK